MGDLDRNSILSAPPACALRQVASLPIRGDASVAGDGCCNTAGPEDCFAPFCMEKMGGGGTPTG